MSRQVELTGVQIANLRGFRDAVLPVSDGLTLLVGPNNSGKTSVLRLLDWALNHVTEETVLGEALLTPDELRLLMPARETRNAARRLVLHVRVLDGRRRSRFQCEGDTAQLRVGLTMPGVLRLNLGPPRRNEASDRGAALDLFQELRDGVAFSLVPAARDAQSASFRSAFRDAVLAKLEERATHAGRRGAPAEYREIKRSLESIRSVADDLVLPLWDEVRESLPPGLATTATVSADLDPGSLVTWVADRIELRIATGEHDVVTVLPEEVGSGLQSLLELALQQTRPEGPEVDRISQLRSLKHSSIRRPSELSRGSSPRTRRGSGWCRRTAQSL
jgi:energy-coupling factor transporter ATP-binding protein EcfA2